MWTLPLPSPCSGWTCRPSAYGAVGGIRYRAVPKDADDSTPGHQVDLAVVNTGNEVAVTAQDGEGTQRLKHLS